MYVYAVFVGCICGGPHLNCMGFAYNPLGPQFRELSVNYAHALPKNEPGAARRFYGRVRHFLCGPAYFAKQQLKPQQAAAAVGCTVGHVGRY